MKPDEAGGMCGWFLALTFRSRRWRRYIPPKLRVLCELHRVTVQKNVLFLVTDKRTSSLPNLLFKLKECVMNRVSSVVDCGLDDSDSILGRGRSLLFHTLVHDNNGIQMTVSANNINI
jgi:hypothetical protein